ncbi:MAG: hypothetical protein IJI65_04345 [Lachnospiraceae bacterium]|nr:hypothetical protein [Lachnospiraceae bacterium]
MKKNSLMRFMTLATALTLTAGVIAPGMVSLAKETPPEPPSGEMGNPPGEPPEGGMGGGPGGPSQSDVSWSGATTITSGTQDSGKTYISENADENALLVETSDAVELSDITVSKTGGTSSSDAYSFYGINSAVMAKDGTCLTINGGTVTTDAAGANGVFSYGANNGTTNATGDGTTVNISDVTITTTGNGSGGIMTTYGGTTNAKDLTITTSGGSSAPIRTDRGGGWVTVDGGTYTSNGLGSPAIYSTADVDVSNATLVSNKSEGVCIEGTGSIELTDCDLTADNNALNGNATFYDTIMIYQSQSGDASDGTSSFTMTGGSLTSKNGDTFHVTNTNAIITLEAVDITNSANGALISVCDDGWSGASNVATLIANDQTLEGSMLVGDDSTLNVNLGNGSVFTGNISGEITNGKGETVSTSIGTVNMALESGSIWVLTGDSEVSSLTGSGSINYNGYTLTVGSSVYQSGSIGNITETDETGESRKDDTEEVTVTDPVTGSTATLSEEIVSEGTVYRLYDPARGEHFYTKSSKEANYLSSIGWAHESDSDFSAVGKDDEDAVAILRVYNPNNGGMHFYTTDVSEVQNLVSAGWIYEGISHYELSTDSISGTPQYRLYNPNSANGEHNWTASESERDMLVELGWINEGIGWKIK